MIDEVKAVAGFLALLTALLGFYVLGLRQGRLDPASQSSLTKSAPPATSVAKSPDVRSELEFINSARLKQPEVPGGKPAERQQGDSSGVAASEFAVELSGFGSRSEAERASESLQNQGFHPKVRNEGSKYRIEIGPYSRRADAQSAAAKLGEMGFSTSVAGR